MTTFDPAVYAAIAAMQAQQAAPPAPAYAPPQYPGYAPPQYPGYAPQQFMPGVPAPPPIPPQQLAQGTLSDFYNQQSTGGGKALSFDQKPYGTTYVGIVSRPMTNGDVQQQTDKQGKGLTFKDGSPKYVMLVPLQLEPSPEHPDGRATWYVKGNTRDELARAMAEVGAPEGPPEQGAIIKVTYTGERPSGAGYNPAKLFAVGYRRPDGAQPAAPAPVTEAVPVPAIPGPGADALAAQQAAFQAQQLAALQAAHVQAAPVPQPAAPAPAGATLQPTQAQLDLLKQLGA